MRIAIRGGHHLFPFVMQQEERRREEYKNSRASEGHNEQKVGLLGKCVEDFVGQCLFHIPCDAQFQEYDRLG